MLDCADEEKEADEIVTILLKHTKYCQLLDKLYLLLLINFAYEDFLIKIYFYSIDVHIYSRDETVKLNSLIHNDISLQRYRSTWKYTIFCYGYIDNYSPFTKYLNLYPLIVFIENYPNEWEFIYLFMVYITILIPSLIARLSLWL